MVWLLILKSLYFFLPAYFANMAPVFARKIPFLGIPISEKWFGKNKTWRGLIIAPIVGIIVFWLQKLAYLSGFQSWAIIDYADFSILLGFLLGLGVIIGDLVKSFHKRRAKIPSGESWFPWDQTDFVLGALAFSFFVYVPPIEVALVLVVASPLLHLLVNYIGFLLGIRERKL